MIGRARRDIRHQRKKAFKTQCTYGLTETVAACVGPMQDQVRWVPSAQRGSRHKMPSFAQQFYAQMITVDKREISFL